MRTLSSLSAPNVSTTRSSVYRVGKSSQGAYCGDPKTALGFETLVVEASSPADIGSVTKQALR